MTAPPAPPIVFEGNAPADVTENELLNKALTVRPAGPPVSPRAWIGAPNSIKGPTEVAFQRQGGSHLLVVGQGEEADLSIPAVALVSLAAQYPPDTVQFILLDSSAPGSPERAFYERVLQAIPHPVLRPRRDEIGSLLKELAAEISQRTGEEPSAQIRTTYLIVPGIHNFKQLRQDDDFAFSRGDTEDGPKPSASFLDLITEGPGKGFHAIVTVDSYNNVVRFLGRKGLAEFQWRVLFQMSPADSASLIDNPEAGKLGLHRAILYNEREGYIEKFRPYQLAGNAWLEHVAASLRANAEVIQT
jgi:hypothetical protein